MITAYHRPQTLDEALTLLTQPNTRPLGGGTLLSHLTSDSVEAVDLQSLGLDTINKKGNDLEIGATTTLQALFENENCPETLKVAIKLEAPINIRNSATIAGTIFSSDGRSPFTTALLSLDAKLEQAIFNNSKVAYRTSNIGEFLPLRSTNLITKIILPLNADFAFEFVSRTPADKPIICAAVTQWGSGRTRLALGGYGNSPILAMDGTEAEGLETAARNAYHEANDEWASADYRMDVASVLAKRCLKSFTV
ncbi:MAG TPA: FAD binding domain-containing protein [Anaerolineales bacterium]|nr:FAD binding domain-containing protein [Anaerolineales bacterium]